jgi:hypothetical protein
LIGAMIAAAKLGWSRRTMRSDSGSGAKMADSAPIIISAAMQA